MCHTAQQHPQTQQKMRETNTIKCRLLYIFDYSFDHFWIGIIFQLILLQLLSLSLIIAELIDDNYNNNNNNNNINNSNNCDMFHVVHRCFGLPPMEIQITLVGYFIIIFSVFKQLILFRKLTLMYDDYVCKAASIDGISIEDKRTNIEFFWISIWIFYRSLLDHITATHVLVKHRIMWLSKDGFAHKFLNFGRSQELGYNANKRRGFRYLFIFNKIWIYYNTVVVRTIIVTFLMLVKHCIMLFYIQCLVIQPFVYWITSGGNKILQNDNGGSGDNCGSNNSTQHNTSSLSSFLFSNNPCVFHCIWKRYFENRMMNTNILLNCKQNGQFKQTSELCLQCLKIFLMMFLMDDNIYAFIIQDQLMTLLYNYVSKYLKHVI